MGSGGIGDEFGNLFESTDEITAETLHVDQRPSALPCVETVSDGVGELTPFRCDRFDREDVANHERPVGLPAENLAQPPRIAQCASHPDRLIEVRLRQVRIVGCDAGACGERSGQQGWIVGVACHGQCL